MTVDACAQPPKPNECRIRDRTQERTAQKYWEHADGYLPELLLRTDLWLSLRARLCAILVAWQRRTWRWCRATFFGTS